MAKNENEFVSESADVEVNVGGGGTWEEEEIDVEELIDTLEDQENNTLAFKDTKKNREVFGYYGDSKTYSFTASLKKKLNSMSDRKLKAGYKTKGDTTYFYVKLLD